MSELILEPYASCQRWQFSPIQMDCKAFFAEYVKGLARRCSMFDTCGIGHIKALALFPGHEYTQVSVVKPEMPAIIQGQIPVDCSEFALTLNVIVYGFTYQQLSQICIETTDHIAQIWKGKVFTEETKLQTTGGSYHPHHHSTKETKHE